MRNKSLDMTTDKIRAFMNQDYGKQSRFFGRASEYRSEVEDQAPFKISKYGFRQLDYHLPWKSSHLIMNIGHPNVGKTFLDFFLLVNLAKKSGLKFVIYSAENRLASMVRQIISMYYGCAYDSLNQNQKNEGFVWVDAHFIFILHIRTYTYKQILLTALDITDKNLDYDGMLIDPYNSLRLDLQGLNKNDYNIQACEEMRVFCEQTEKTILMNCHTTSESQRRKVGGRNDEGTGRVERPMYSDVEGGGPFTSKGDDIWVTHRNVRDSHEWMITELYVEKIRNSEYGGRINAWTEPIRFRIRQDHSGYDIEPTAEERRQAQQAEIAARQLEPRFQSDNFPLPMQQDLDI